MCTGLAILLEVDASGAGTTGAFGRRSQEAEVATASIIHCTRGPHYITEKRTLTKRDWSLANITSINSISQFPPQHIQNKQDREYTPEGLHTTYHHNPDSF